MRTPHPAPRHANAVPTPASDGARSSCLRLFRRVVGAVVAAIVFLGAAASAPAQTDPARRTVILISMDGIRGDYVTKEGTPFLDGLRAESAHSRHLIAVFPSLTFPNHTSIATGRHVDAHGIVSNKIVEGDKVLNHPSETGLVQAKPLWVHTEECGVRTALDLWPVGYGAWHGKRPTLQRPSFEADRKDPETVDKLLGWLRLPDAERPRFVMAYFRGADKAGHNAGPDSAEVKTAMKELDSTLQRFFGELRKLPGAADLAVVLVTDHGMCDVKKMINLQALWGREKLSPRYATSGPVANIFAPDKADQDKILAALAGVKELQAWRASEMPVGLHYRHARSGDVIALAAEGMMFKERANSSDVIYVGDAPKGMHGYLPDLPSMHGFFLAWGAGIRRGAELEKLSVLDVFPTVCALLGVVPPGEIEGRALEAALVPVEKKN